jgi:hypothetical protein
MVNELDPRRNDVGKELNRDPSPYDKEPKACGQQWISEVALRLSFALLVANDEEYGGQNGGKGKSKPTGKERESRDFTVSKREAAEFVVRWGWCCLFGFHGFRSALMKSIAHARISERNPKHAEKKDITMSSRSKT